MISRKRKDLSHLDKLTILKLADKKVKRSEIAKQYDISESTVSVILSNRSEIEDMCKDNLNFNKKRRRDSKFKDIEKCLYEWFLDKRRMSIPINGTMLFEKSYDFAALLNRTDFKPNNGWLHRFKLRHNISQHRISGERESVDIDLVQDWIDNIYPKLIEQYQPNCIYNADETGLFYKMLPEYTLDTKGEQTHGIKKSKERLTVLFCCNSDGSDKICPLVIGKSKKPRCFNGVKNLPVHYEANTYAWMNNDLFKQWLMHLDSRMRKINKNIILFLDNFGGHKVDFNFTNMKLAFYPANCTSLLQPLDQGIIKSFKSKYRTRMLKQILSRVDLQESVEDINVYLALELIASSWKEITVETIRNCFALAGQKNTITFPILEENGNENILQTYCKIRNIEQIDFNVYNACDDNLSTMGVSTDQEIVDNIITAQITSDLQTAEDEFFIDENIIDLNTAISYIDQIKLLFRKLDLDNSTLISTEEMLINERLKTIIIRQSSIKDYFETKE